MQNELTENPRPRFRTVEKVILALSLTTFILPHTGYPGKGVLTMVIVVIFLFAGYYIFLPPKQIKGGPTLSIINGVVNGSLFLYISWYCFAAFIDTWEDRIRFKFFLGII